MESWTFIPTGRACRGGYPGGGEDVEEHEGTNWYVTRSWPGQQFLMFMSSPCIVPLHFYFFFPTALQNRCCQHSHFTDENVEAYNPKCFPKDRDSRLASHAQSLLYGCPGSLQHTHHSDPCLNQLQLLWLLLQYPSEHKSNTLICLWWPQAKLPAPLCLFPVMSSKRKCTFSSKNYFSHICL